MRNRWPLVVYSVLFDSGQETAVAETLSLLKVEDVEVVEVVVLRLLVDVVERTLLVEVELVDDVLLLEDVDVVSRLTTLAPTKEQSARSESQKFRGRPT